MKVCYKCKKEKAVELYHLDKTRPDGRCYKCKDCCKGRVDNRKNRWINSTEEQKNKKRVNTSLYRKTIKGKSIDIISSYKQYDNKKGFINDLTQEFIINSLSEPCFYCQDISTGLDRINNNVGHTINNCVSCCKECNVARMDNFTHEEMILLGKTIKQIKLKRVYDAPHFEKTLGHSVNDLKALHDAKKFIPNTNYVAI